METLLDPVLIETLGTVLAALLTVMVLTYVLGDNAFFRTATFLFVGVAGGYAGAVAWYAVLQPTLVAPVLALDPGFLFGSGFLTDWAIPLFLVVLLFLRLVPGAGRLGSLPVAILLGVGAASVVGGAITGTIVPQTLAAMETLNPFAVAPATGEAGLERLGNALIVLVGTVSTLAYFGFGVKRGDEHGPRWTIQRVKTPIGFVPVPWPLFPFLGEIFIAITFGVMFAGALSASLLYLTERVQFLGSAIQFLLGGLGIAP
ncbi:MAG TPA: hypothetical protein VLL77_08390 [Anaerolineales bacterium]|nr:hypothetical protein [Anaerolineales bacterium]